MKAITEVGNGSDCEPWQLTTGLIPVCDELEALEFLIDDDEPALRRVAAVWRNRPALVQIRARAQFHTSEIARLLGYAQDGTVRPDPAVLESAKALALLIDSANIASLLVAPRGHDDHRALAGLRRAMRKVATRSCDPDVRGLVTQICGGEFVAMSEAHVKSPRLPPLAYRSDNASAGRPGLYSSTSAPSLQLWLTTGIDPADLLDGARSLLKQLDIWHRVQSRISEPGLLEHPIRGAELLAYSRLARVVLWPARDADEIAIRQEARAVIAPRDRDPDRLRAVVEWAFERGAGRS